MINNNKNNPINKIINLDGRSKYGYVTFVLKNVIYASPAIVLAESLRKIGCLGTLICMIDSNIDKETIDLLRRFYDKIILVDLIKIENPDPIQKIILTKLECLNLDSYEKIFLIDVDTIFLTNIDNLFENKQDENLLLNSGINYGILLLKPSKKKYQQAKNIILNDMDKLINVKKPFIYMMKKLYNDIKNLDLIISSDKYENTDGIQYTIDKPFLMSSDKTIEQRVKLDHFKIWFNYLTIITNLYPTLHAYKCLQETIEVSKYFLVSLSRFIITNKNKKKKNRYIIIKEIYGNTKYSNSIYYHLDISKEYNQENINFNLPICDLKNILDFLIKINPNLNIKKNLFKFLNIKDLIKNTQEKKLIDIILTQYININPNVFVVLEINSTENSASENILDLNNLIYEKFISFKGIVLKNIIFNIFQVYTYEQRIELISDLSDNLNYNLIITIYETINPLYLYDTLFSYKKFFIIENNSKIRLTSVLLNENTLKKFNNKSLKWLDLNHQGNLSLNRNSLNKILLFQTLKKWIYNNYNGEQIINIILLNQQNKKITILDNNEYNQEQIKNLMESKINFVNIIFTKSSNFIKNDSDINFKIEYIYNDDYYWELEGIKFFNKDI